MVSNLSGLQLKNLSRDLAEPDIENSPDLSKNVNLNFSVDTKNYINLQIDQSKRSTRINQAKISRHNTGASNK
jgi:predicted metalloenzyme YecM